MPTGPWHEIAYWFCVLAAITWVCATAAAAENKGLVTVLVFLALGATAGALGEFFVTGWLMILAGYLFVVASIAAWYSASALMLNEAFGRKVLGTRQNRGFHAVGFYRSWRAWSY